MTTVYINKKQNIPCMLEYPKAATTDTKLIFKLSYTYKGKVYKKRYAVII